MEKKKIHIIVDTNEQKPLTFSNFDVEVSRDSLQAGDYTITGHDMPGDDNSVIIERKKDCQELVGNLGRHWQRFMAEAELLKQYKTRQIVVCGPDNFQYLFDRGFTKLHPNFIYKQLSILLVEYGIPTIFLPDRDTAENYMFRLFYQTLRKTDAES